MCIALTSNDHLWMSITYSSDLDYASMYSTYSVHIYLHRPSCCAYARTAVQLCIIYKLDGSFQLSSTQAEVRVNNSLLH